VDPIEHLGVDDDSIPSNVVAFPQRLRPAEQADIDDVDGETERDSSTFTRVAHPSVDDALSTLRNTRVAADAIPALSAVAQVRPDPSRQLRIGLLVVSLLQLAIGLAWLVGEVPFGRLIGNPTPAHLSRDAALGVILGTIGAIVGWRPRWSLSLLPVVGSIVFVQALGLIADAAKGQRGFHFEHPHLVAIVIGALTFLVSRKRRAPNPTHT
jgi:hypothetical protein